MKLGLMGIQQMKRESGLLHVTTTLINWVFILTGTENNAYNK